MSELHLLDILAARHGCFISDLNLTPFLRRAGHPVYHARLQGAVPYP